MHRRRSCQLAATGPRALANEIPPAIAETRIKTLVASSIACRLYFNFQLLRFDMNTVCEVILAVREGKLWSMITRFYGDGVVAHHPIRIDRRIVP